MSDKRPFMERSGYAWNPKKKIYFNVTQRKIFSREWVDNHDENSIRAKITEPNPATGWQFYSNEQISAPAQQQIIDEITKTRRPKA
jgi:hypothetical protein